MIIIKIMGGLGNQLFTYATAYALAKRNKTQLVLDEQIYQTFYSLRNCQLHEFNIEAQSVLIKRSIGHNKITNKVYNAYHDLLLRKKYHVHLVEEIKQFECQEFDINSNENYYLKGYWQNYRYFDAYRSDLMRQINPKIISKDARELIERAKECKPTALHIRRGDYKTFQGGKCLGMEYYSDAIDLITQKTRRDNLIWIFTDDIEFCKEQFGTRKDIVYIGEQAKLSDVDEFNVMKHCENFILANSSFSWWAAYLCNCKNKKVVAPVVDMWKREFYLPEWYTIDATLE